MRRIPSEPKARRREIDELDTDFLETLEQRSKRLYTILSKATRYRGILGAEIKRLRAGSAPETARALLAQWDSILREIKRLAQDL
jgi:hypothetical protein